MTDLATIPGIAPIHDLDAWFAGRTSTLRCIVTSIIHLDGSHPTGVMLGVDLRPTFEGKPALYVVRLDGEADPRWYQRHEVDF